MAIRRRGCGDGNGGSGNMRGRREVEETTAVKVAEKKTGRNLPNDAAYGWALT